MKFGMFDNLSLNTFKHIHNYARVTMPYDKKVISLKEKNDKDTK